MKNLKRLIAILCVIPFCAYTQNYQLVHPEKVSAFLSQDDLIYFLAIDSISSTDNRILYPNRINTQVEEWCYSPFQASWIGRSIIAGDDGIYYFLNKSNDSIAIYSQALPGEEWVALELDGYIYKANVISLDYGEFLGIEDSIKTIGFQVYDLELNPLESYLNDLQIKISKSHGLIQTLNFFIFPHYYFGIWYESQVQELALAGLSSPEVGVQNLTWKDVHDHQPGDILHVLRKNGIWEGEVDGYFKTTETRKTMEFLERTDYNDSIVYSYLLNKRVHLQWLDSLAFYTDTVKMVVEPDPDFDKYPMEPIFYYSQGDPLTFTYNWMKTGEEHLMKWEMSIEFEKITENCWEPVMFDGFPRQYWEGLGGPYYPEIGLFGYLYQRELVYYKKGDVTWGTPLDMTSIEAETLADRIRVYPNPAKDILKVRLENPHQHGAQLRITDLNGRLMHTETLQSGINSIRISHLSPGLYFCVITCRQGRTIVQKIVVK